MTITFSKDIRWLLLLPLVFNLLLLTPLLGDGFPHGGDSIGHLMMAAKTKEILQHFFATGELRLWQDWHFMGSPLFYYYSPLPAVTVALLSMVTSIDLLLAYKIIIVLLYLALPFAVYLSCILLQLEKKTAVIAALLSVLPVSIYGFGFEYRAFFDFGLFTQLFGTLLFMLGFAACYQFIFVEKIFQYRWFFLSSIFTALAFLSHILAGYFVLFFLGIFFMVYCFLRKTIALEQLKRLLVLGALVFVLSSFVLLPTLVDKEHFAGLPLDPPARQQGLGLSRVAGFLFSGDLLDYQTLPLLTLLLGLSFFGFFFLRKDLQDQRFFILGVIVSIVVSFLLIAGKKTFSFLAFVPTLNDLQTFRFILPFHFFVIFLIATAFVFFLARIKQQRLQHIVLICFIVVIITAYGFAFIKTKQLTEPILSQEENKGFYAFADDFQKLPLQGRVYTNVSQLSSSYAPFQALQWYTRFPSFNVLGAGYHDTFSVFYTIFPFELYQDVYSLFNIQYVIGRNNAGLPTVTAVPSTGYFDFGYAPLLLQSSLADARGINLAWLSSALPKKQQYMIISNDIPSEKFPIVLQLLDTSPGFTAVFDTSAIGNERQFEIDFDPEHTPLLGYYITDNDKTSEGEAKASVFFQSLQFPLSESCGVVVNESSELGTYQAEVIVQENCFLLLKVSYHPQWKAFVDDKTVAAFTAAPNLMGVFVPEGKHTVTYIYQESWWRKLSLIVGLLVFAGLLAALFMRRNA